MGDIRFELNFRSKNKKQKVEENIEKFSFNKSVFNSTKGYIGAGVNSQAVTKISEDFTNKNDIITTYTINDYCWSEQYNSNAIIDTNITVPKMILTEFQPIKNLSWKDLLASIGDATFGLFTTPGNIASKLGTTIGAGGLVNATTDVISKASQLSVGKLLFKSPQTLQQEYSEGGSSSAIGSKTMKYIENLITGEFLYTFELPFISNDYIKADTTGAWSAGGSEDYLGNYGKFMAENFSVSVPMAPVWNRGDDNKLDIKYDFYLINNSNENLYKNFKFLHSLVSGCFWIQLGIMQQSPNLYDVIVPGRFHKNFCALGVTIEYAGKTRINDVVSNRLSSEKRTISAKHLDPKNEDRNDKQMIIPADMLYPDAYKVSVNLRDLTPNNYNVYLKYLYNPSDKVTVKKNIVSEGPGGFFRESLSQTETGKAIMDKGADVLNYIGFK